MDMNIRRRLHPLILVASLGMAVGASAQPPNISELRRAAEAGDASAQYDLGTALLAGAGTPVNEAEAIKWLMAAAEHGITGAMLIVARANEGNYGVKRDLAQAVKWYEDAADTGSPEAMAQLGLMYEKGIGVPQDFTKAAHWYQEGAKWDYPNAMFALGVMYFRGAGVSKDLAEAHKWVNLAATLADGADQKEMMRIRDDMTKYLAPEQLADAQTRARTWLQNREKERQEAQQKFFGSTSATGRAVAPTAPPVPGAVRVGGNIKQPAKIKDVKPKYPAEAQSARIQGVVILEVTIGVDGKVIDAKVLRSIPLLDQAAIDAVKQWEFSQTLLNGVPVPVIMTATVNFTLQ
jgi:TonB family protein